MILWGPWRYNMWRGQWEREGYGTSTEITTPLSVQISTSSVPVPPSPSTGPA